MRLFPVVLVPLALAAAAGCAKEVGSRPSGGPPEVFVEIDTVRREALPEVVEMVGALIADESVMIRPETEGLVDSVSFAEGQEVEEGTLLVQLRDAEERALLAEAEAQLALARHEFTRAQALAGKRSLSESELDRARAQMEVARARLERRRAELAQKVIRAPFDGVLGARLVAPGDRVDRDTDIVQIDAIDRVKLVFTLPEIAVGLARPGVPLEVGVAPYPGDSFPGEIYFVAPTVDPRNRRLLVKAIVPNADHRLRPGLFANIRAEIAVHDDALVIPETAVAYDARGAFVWKVTDEDVAERIAVDMGVRTGGRVQVLAGLAAGDRIVSPGTHKPMARSPVRAVDAAPAA